MNNSLIQWLIPLSATFVGAGLAFLLNIRHNSIVLKNDRKTKLTVLVVNVTILLDKFLGLKKYVFLPRAQECVDIKKDEKQIYEYLLGSCQSEKISFDISMFDIGFVAEYDPRLYLLILALNNRINNLNKVIEDLNNHINFLSTKDVPNDREAEILCSYTENAVELIDHCLYFSEIADALLIDLGNRKFKPFKIWHSTFPDSEEKFLPANLGLGWGDLYEKAMRLKNKKNKKFNAWRGWFVDIL